MPSELTKIVNSELTRLRGIISPGLAEFGFKPTKARLWVREADHVAGFLLLERHGSSYGAPSSASVALEMRAGLRVLNSGFPSLGLNGPSSDRASRSDGLHFHTRFNARSGSQFERCCEDLVRFAAEVFVPWSAQWSAEGKLLAEGSPLSRDDQEALRAAVAGAADVLRLAQSRKLLGLAPELSPD